MPGPASGGHAHGNRPPLALDMPGVRVRTLVLLRWVAICGQLVALLVVGLGYGFPLPWVAALAAIATSAFLNILLNWSHRRRDRVSGETALLHLGFDQVQLSTLLFLTGGLNNPFALLLLVPVTISATILSARATAILVVAALLLLAGLWSWHLPLPWPARDALFLPDLYRLGMLTAIALGMLFLVTYVWQVSAEGRRRQAALVATQAALERESRMGALGSFAAAAAHELGGPLGTITLIAHDLHDALGQDPAHGADVLLLEQETRRCRDILREMSRNAEQDDPFPNQPLPTLLRETIEALAPTRVPVTISTPWAKGSGPRLPHSPELLHGLHNLVANAVRHAASQVVLSASETASELSIRIDDDGAGFPDDLLPHLGDPFLGPSRSQAGSTGLGIFIAITLLERTGARLAFANRPEGGARVELLWKRRDIEIWTHAASQVRSTAMETPRKGAA